VLGSERGDGREEGEVVSSCRKLVRKDDMMYVDFFKKSKMHDKEKKERSSNGVSLEQGAIGRRTREMMHKAEATDPPQKELEANIHTHVLSIQEY